MMEDDKIAVFCLVAGEEVQEEIANAKHVEKCANIDAPNFITEILVKCIHEGYVEIPKVRHERHGRVPVKPMFWDEMKYANCV